MAFDSTSVVFKLNPSMPTILHEGRKILVEIAKKLRHMWNKQLKFYSTIFDCIACYEVNTHRTKGEGGKFTPRPTF